jgi:hypothetical protein
MGVRGGQGHLSGNPTYQELERCVALSVDSPSQDHQLSARGRSGKLKGIVRRVARGAGRR